MSASGTEGGDSRSETGISREGAFPPRALASALESFTKVYDASPDCVSVVRASDGVIVDVNSSFVELLGWTREEAIGSTATALAIWPHPTDRNTVLKEIERRRLRYVEQAVRRKDGSLMDALLSMKPLELAGHSLQLIIARDVTDLQKTRRALQASEARLMAFARATFEGIAISEGGRVAHTNEQLEAMFGMEPEEMIGKDVRIMVAPESLPMVMERMQAGYEEPYEHLSMRKDGTVFPVEIRARSITVAGRHLRVTAIRDITERKRAELEREQLIAELQARNAEMEQFTYTVSHDLKSPLVTISGFLGLLERDVAAGDTQKVEKDLARIGSATNKMMRLLSDLLELSRVGRVTQPKSRVSLSEIVREALELVSGPLAARGVRVNVAPVLPDVLADKVRMVQVLQNLLENAIKYMGPEAEPRIEIGTRPDPAFIVLFVRDNGIGIEARHHERIFGLFEKLDPKSEGTGVGLALVKRIVEFHGGSIRVESGEGGSTFVLRLPQAPSRSDRTDRNKEGTAS